MQDMKMTVNELIEKLKQLPQFGDSPVGVKEIDGDEFPIDGVSFIRHPISDGAAQYVLIEYQCRI
jgi:hypothetical protein